MTERRKEQRAPMQGARRPPRASQTSRVRPQNAPSGYRPPSNTGRLVEPLKGSDSAGERSVHWCPAEGETWTCPSCGAAFVRGDVEWRAAA